MNTGDATRPQLAPLSYSLEEAPAVLGSIFTVEFLRSHIEDLPHIRLGKGRGRAGRIGFTEDQLREIVARYAVPARPLPKPQPVDARPPAATAGFPSMVTRTPRARSA